MIIILKDFYDKMTNQNSKAASFMRATSKIRIARFREKGWNFVMCDEVLMACALDPTLQDKVVTKHATVHLGEENM